MGDNKRSDLLWMVIVATTGRVMGGIVAGLSIGTLDLVAVALWGAGSAMFGGVAGTLVGVVLAPLLRPVWRGIVLPISVFIAGAIGSAAIEIGMVALVAQPASRSTIKPQQPARNLAVEEIVLLQLLHAELAGEERVSGENVQCPAWAVFAEDLAERAVKAA